MAERKTLVSVSHLITNIYQKYSTAIDISLGLISGIILTLGSVYLFSPKLISKRYAYVDVPKIIAEVTATLSVMALNTETFSTMTNRDQSLDDREKKKLIELARNSFYQEIEQYSKSQNVVIVSTCKAISGTEDITDKILPKVLRTLSK